MPKLKKITNPTVQAAYDAGTKFAGDTSFVIRDYEQMSRLLTAMKNVKQDSDSKVPSGWASRQTVLTADQLAVIDQVLALQTKLQEVHDCLRSFTDGRFEAKSAK